jgi:hypothetical protein
LQTIFTLVSERFPTFSAPQTFICFCRCLLELLNATKQSFDVEYVGLVGAAILLPSTTSTNTHSMPMSSSLTENRCPVEYEEEQELLSSLSSTCLAAPSQIVDVGNHLGVKKRVKRFEYSGVDFDTNGLLYWIGTSEGEKTVWVNPVTTGAVSLTTSHPMYSVSMKIEDIIGREGGSSCYWGNSCPQYFMLDLKHRRIRCNYFTLRHGYQAANSFIQNWSFSGSNDGINWTPLYESLINDTPFTKPFETKSWPVPDPKDYFRFFRVLQTGNYSMGRGTTGGGSAYLCIAGFEVYGELLRD